MKVSTKKIKKADTTKFNPKNFVTDIKNIDLNPSYKELNDFSLGLTSLKFFYDLKKETNDCPKMVNTLVEKIFENFEISRINLLGFNIRVIKPDEDFEFSSMGTVCGARFVSLVNVPKKISDLNFLSKSPDDILTNDSHIVDYEGRTNFPIDTVSFDFASAGIEDKIPYVLNHGNISMVPFGFVQMMGMSFDSSNYTTLQSYRPGGRPIHIKKNTHDRIIICADALLGQVALKKAVKVFEEIQETLFSGSMGNQDKIFSIILKAGERLLKVEANDDISEDISLMDLAGSVARMVKGNKFVLNMISGYVRRSMGEGEMTDSVIAGITEISKCSSMEEAKSKMTNLLLSNEKLSGIMNTVMGMYNSMSGTSKENEEIPVFDD